MTKANFLVGYWLFDVERERFYQFYLSMTYYAWMNAPLAYNVDMWRELVWCSAEQQPYDHTCSLNWSLTDNTNRASLFKLFFLVLKTSFFSHLTRVKEYIDWIIVLTRATINSDLCIWIMFNIIFILKKYIQKFYLNYIFDCSFKSECLILT